MPDDYGTTAAIMRHDAVMLAEARRWRNACYLAGYVVECVVKALLDAAGQTPKRHHDLGKHGQEVQKLSLVCNPVVARYGDPIAVCSSIAGGSGWDPVHRYDGTRWTEREWTAYARDSERAYEMLCEMYVDGAVGVIS